MMGSPPGQLIALRSPQNAAISSLAFSADSQFLAAVGQAGEVTVWQVASSAHRIQWQQTYAGVWLDQLAWHPQQNLLAVGVGSQVELWQIPTGDRLASLDFQASSVLNLVWHPSGDSLAVSGHGGIKVWQTHQWQKAAQLIQVPGASIAAAWSQEGRYLGSGNLDRTLTVVEWGSPPPWLMQGFPGKVRQVCWSMPPTSGSAPLLAAACAEGITVWERETTQRGWRSRVLQHHQDTVIAIAFQPHSQLLASASREGQIALWQNGKQLAQTLKNFRQGVSCLVWHPAGDRLVVGGSAGKLQIWHLTQRQAKGFGA